MMKVILNGNFTWEHLKKIATTLGNIEKENPDEFYMMLLEDNKLSVKEAADIVHRLLEVHKFLEITDEKRIARWSIEPKCLSVNYVGGGVEFFYYDNPSSVKEVIRKIVEQEIEDNKNRKVV